MILATVGFFAGIVLAALMKTASETDAELERMEQLERGDEYGQRADN